MVALDEGVEGVLVTLPGQRDELLIVLEAKEGRAPGEKPASLCVCECGSFQDRGDFEALSLPPETP